MKKSIYISLALFLGLCLSGTAQNRKQIEYSGFFDTYYYRGPLNITLGGGLAGYLGDVPMKLGTGFNLGASYMVWPRTYFGLDLNYLMLNGEKKDTSGNVSFSSTLYEIIAYGRFNLIDKRVLFKNDINKRPPRIRPYITLGIGAVYMQPKVTVTDTNFFSKYELTKASNVAIVFPASLGFAFYLSKRFTILTEFGYRYTLTDGIDGLNKVNTSAFDSYGTAMLKIQYSFHPFKKRRAKYVPPAEGGYSGGGGGHKAPKDSTLNDPILPPGAPADSSATPANPNGAGDGSIAPPAEEKPKELTEEEKKKLQEEKEQKEWENSWETPKPQPADKKKTPAKAPAKAPAKPKPAPQPDNSGW